ncbi:MAG TPA: hypothetical protein VGW80_04845 [Solirubrobacterales bacterium]|nr:hypothetical protein [Solirubrobacterales bacterium]
MSHRLLASAWARALACFALSLAPLFAICAYSQAAPIPATKLLYGTGKIVPIPASIAHEEGDMVDKRILPDLRWIAKRYPIYVTDGYSGPLPNGEHAGCNRCHTRGSDHYNGLAVDLVPLNGDGKCDSTWAGITRLAHWAEPVQNSPRAPFRWVGYDGDSGHGCGNHLHLSWNHAIAAEYTLAQWVEVFAAGSNKGAAPTVPPKPPVPPAPPRPSGGISQTSYGGVSARGTGD